jgi:hypothetical protein
VCVRASLAGPSILMSEKVRLGRAGHKNAHGQLMSKCVGGHVAIHFLPRVRMVAFFSSFAYS